MMMIGRRILQKRIWSSGLRWLSPPPEISAKNFTFIGCFSHSAVSFRVYSNRGVDLNNLNRVKNRCWFSSEALADNVPVSGGVVDVPLAQTGEGIAECELLKWFVQEGDQIEEFQQLCEVQSDKATIEITSRYKGKVVQILYTPGDIVKVGETLLRMVVDESQVPTLVGDNLENMKPDASEMQKNYVGGVHSTPAVRHLANQYGIDINGVCGTGKDGRVLKEDVLKYAFQKGIIKDPPATLRADTANQWSGGEYSSSHVSSSVIHQHDDTTVPLRGFQRAMVRSMSMAAKVPHFHYVEEINCDALIELKSSFQNNNTDPNVKHTFLPLLIKSLSMALSNYPSMNSCFNEESLVLVHKGSHNIGIAMASPSGLVVPNIKNVQSLSILGITKELSRLQQLATDNKLSPGHISSGTITLSNIGSIGGKFGAPIINLPEVSIIAIGRIQKVPRFGEDNNVYPASIMTVNIGADHRVLDGATVAKFCNQWKEYIEKPELLLLHLR
ncbi:2-oxoacid_dh domain-containing protein/Biotin_lipoyl domain-containing protein/E3_binding domain-containing protein [Cephalotus follicularis]|uniref:Dihydrolipoamide acetyltransferase component of pyruvate dehydrogenase complex n=1 Tax=Cephalotus follicularis TaxID=3775 RepID=A0A1Q3B8P2_CEPFO|nr:2-oxoacid_dh domain-containing protein/Biotin_lipoyl domain-containing protein/E3_binding domain-containing protein [Cephalotus follicularis]